MRKNLPIVEIEWEDAASDGRWKDEDDWVENCKPLMCRSVGWLAKSSRQRIILVGSRASNGDASSWEQIPRGCIRSMRYVEK